MRATYFSKRRVKTVREDEEGLGRLEVDLVKASSFYHLRKTVSTLSLPNIRLSQDSLKVFSKSVWATKQVLEEDQPEGWTIFAALIPDERKGMKGMIYEELPEMLFPLCHLPSPTPASMSCSNCCPDLVCRQFTADSYLNLFI